MMQNRLKAVRQKSSGFICRDTDSGNRQSVLVLIGFCIILIQVVSSLLVVSPLNLTADSRPAVEILLVRSEQFKNQQNSAPEISYYPAEIAPLFFQQIPINEASADLLATIPGIGPHMGKKIRDYILENGPMTTLTEVENIKGIGLQKSKIIAKYARI